MQSYFLCFEAEMNGKLCITIRALQTNLWFYGQIGPDLY